jgi:hypothetical protein
MNLRDERPQNIQPITSRSPDDELAKLRLDRRSLRLDPPVVRFADTHRSIDNVA